VDQPRKGIRKDCIKQICKRIQHVTSEEVENIMRVWDRDFDGLISFEEFHLMLGGMESGKILNPENVQSLPLRSR